MIIIIIIAGKYSATNRMHFDVSAPLDDVANISSLFIEYTLDLLHGCVGPQCVWFVDFLDH